MRRKAILAASTLLIAFTLSAGAVVAQQNMKNVQTDIWLQGSSCADSGTQTGVSNIERTDQKVTWRGVIDASSPQHNLRYQVADASQVQEGLYRLNIEPVAPGNDSVQDCRGQIRYEGSFQTGEEFVLAVYHDGERTGVIRSEDYQQDLSEQLREGGRDVWGFFDNQAKDFQDWTRRTYPQLYDGEGIVRWN